MSSHLLKGDSKKLGHIHPESRKVGIGSGVSFFAIFLITLFFLGSADSSITEEAVR